jgi:Bacterial regulatory helix-turn-helix protein, lysR family
MNDLNDLYYFAMVVEHSGFAAAERALGIPKSRLSRRISQLETDMGARPPMLVKASTGTRSRCWPKRAPPAKWSIASAPSRAV